MVQNGSKMGHFWPPNLQGEPCKWLKKGSKSGQKGVKNDPFLTKNGSFLGPLLSRSGRTCSGPIPVLANIPHTVGTMAGTEPVLDRSWPELVRC